MTSSKRDHLIEVALRLFAKHGYHATGIDRILKESGLAKKTLYTHFQSKEDLIVAVLRKYDETFLATVKAKVETRADSPREQLLALFDVVSDWLTGADFYGCMFINAIGEYSDAESAIREVCRSFKDSMHYYIQGLCVQALIPEPEQVADQLTLLIEGAIVVAQVSNKNNAAMTAKEVAKVIISTSREAQ